MIEESNLSRNFVRRLPKLSLVYTRKVSEFIARFTEYTSSLSLFPCSNIDDPYNVFDYRSLHVPYSIANCLSYLYLHGLDSTLCVCSYLLPKHVHAIGLTRCEPHGPAVSAIR